MYELVGIKLQDFRAFDMNEYLEIGNFNVYLGKNSSGKSTLIRILPLLKQTILSTRQVPIIWFSDNYNYVDFESLNNVLSQDSLDGTITMGFKFKDSNEESSITMEMKIDSKDFKEIVISDEVNNFKLVLKGDNLDLDKKIYEVWYNDLKEPYEYIFQESIDKGKFLNNRFKLKLKEKTIANKEYGIKIDFSEKQVKYDIEEIIKNSSNYKDYKEFKNYKLYEEYDLVNDRDILTYFQDENYSAVLINSVLKNKINRYNSIDAVKNSLNKSISEYSRIEKHISNIDELENYQKIIINPMEKVLDKINNLNDGEEEFMSLLKAYKLSYLLEDINSTIKSECGALIYFSPIRTKAQRWYRPDSNVSMNNVDRDGSNLPVIWENLPLEGREEFNQWLNDYFDIELDIKSHKETSYQISLKGCGSQEYYNIIDLGFGYSQILPILYTIWDKTKYIEKVSSQIDESINNKNVKAFADILLNIIPINIFIEQPELHLHPEYQAKLIDLLSKIVILIEESGLPISINITIETHSETIINRLGALVAYKKLDCESVNINIFNKNLGKVIIDKAKIDKDGRISNWPMGFFATGDFIC